MDVMGKLENVREALVLVSRNIPGKRYMLSDVKLVSDALVTIGDIQRHYKEETLTPPVRLLTQHEINELASNYGLTGTQDNGLINLDDLAALVQEAIQMANT